MQPVQGLGLEGGGVKGDWRARVRLEGLRFQNGCGPLGVGRSGWVRMDLHSERRRGGGGTASKQQMPLRGCCCGRSCLGTADGPTGRTAAVAGPFRGLMPPLVLLGYRCCSPSCQGTAAARPAREPKAHCTFDRRWAVGKPQAGDHPTATLVPPSWCPRAVPAGPCCFFFVFS